MGYQDNPHFFRAIVKYGWDNFKHEILFEGLTEDEAYEKEKELIKHHKSNDFQYGFNRSSGGRYPNEGCHTRRTFKVKNPRRGCDAPHAKPVCQFSIHGKWIKTWGSGSEASEGLHIKGSSGISHSCKFKQVMAHGYIWLYADEADRIDEKLQQIKTKYRRNPKKKATGHRLIVNGRF